MTTLVELAADLAAGRTTSAQLVEDCLARATDPAGEGARACTLVDADGAREQARRIDSLRATGRAPSPYAGIPVSVKDLFDVRGQVTRAGSIALDGPPAERDSPAVAHWRAAGLVIVARTNMTEFAYSGLGLNPHYGTPLNPWDRATGRIPGGSSSGAAVTVTDGMAHGALGTDTGGSCRIPAAMCGIVGLKPTQSRIPLEGMVPLSVSFDTVGVLGRSVGCCAILDALATGEDPALPRALDRPPRLALPVNYVRDDVEPAIAADFERAVRRLADAGAELEEVTIPEFDAIGEMNAAGGISAAESWAWHRELIAARGGDYDPRVRVRIQSGEGFGPDDVARMHAWRAELIADARRRFAGYDAFACPTVPIVAPPLAAFAEDAEYKRLNKLVLRNATVVNVLDGCAISVPMHEPGQGPAGLMVAGMGGEDAAMLRIAAWIEQRIRPA